MKLILRTKLPIELTNGNEGKSKDWRVAHRVKQNIDTLLNLHQLARVEPFDVPVVVVVTRILGPRQSKWDSSNGLRGNWKEIQDALVKVNWFHDDNTRWIKETRFFQDASRRKEGPSIEVSVYEYERSEYELD